MQFSKSDPPGKSTRNYHISSVWSKISVEFIIYLKYSTSAASNLLNFMSSGNYEPDRVVNSPQERVIWKQNSVEKISPKPFWSFHLIYFLEDQFLSSWNPEIVRTLINLTWKKLIWAKVYFMMFSWCYIVLRTIKLNWSSLCWYISILNDYLILCKIYYNYVWLYIKK